jgi:hypothetical protein
MLLFRSEGDIDDWCRRNGRPKGAVLAAGALQKLGSAWYGDRLDPDWRPRSREESQAILDALGLSGEFWRLPEGPAD